MPVSQDATSASQLAEAVMENAPVAIIVSDGTGMITYANAVALRYFGYSRDEWIAQSVDILLPKQFRHRHIEHRRKYSEHSTPRPMGQGRELAGLRKDGTEFPIEVSLQPLPTATGIAVTTVIVDVTERRKLEDYQRISDRLGAVRQIAAPMANEFNNILPPSWATLN